MYKFSKETQIDCSRNVFLIVCRKVKVCIYIHACVFMHRKILRAE